MKQQGGESIINISSTVGIHSFAMMSVDVTVLKSMDIWRS